VSEILAPSVHFYGEHRDQFAELTLPPGSPGGGAVPVVVLVHGGFWRARYDLHLGNALVTDLAGRGVAVWNLEYRRLGLLRHRGGWPETMLDVAAGIDALDEARDGDASLDVTRVAAVGHSAGGQLALWAAARAGMPAGAPGAQPRVPLAAAVAQAGVVDLIEAERMRLGGGVVRRLLGASAEAAPDRYALASPTARLPLGVPHLLVHGERDETVPLSISERHHARAVEAGDDCELEAIAGEGHFEHLDPTSEAWAATVRWLERRLR
jgi:acetyl esterase/lipase